MAEWRCVTEFVTVPARCRIPFLAIQFEKKIAWPCPPAPNRQPCGMTAVGYKPTWAGQVETQPGPHELHALITVPELLTSRPSSGPSQDQRRHEPGIGGSAHPREEYAPEMGKSADSGHLEGNGWLSWSERSETAPAPCILAVNMTRSSSESKPNIICELKRPSA